jgi:hypothetical protein
MRKQSDIAILSCLALVLTGALGCVTASRNAKWPVFYDCEKGPEHLSIAREPKCLAFFTNEIPEWNYALRVPSAKIIAAKTKELGELKGLRVVEVQLSLNDAYYSDVLMILQEIKNDQFLPVYVQDYNQGTREPSKSSPLKTNLKLIIEAGMDYSGTGHFHNHYKITLAANHDPHVTGSFY